MWCLTTTVLREQLALPLLFSSCNKPPSVVEGLWSQHGMVLRSVRWNPVCSRLRQQLCRCPKRSCSAVTCRKSGSLLHDSCCNPIIGSGSNQRLMTVHRGYIELSSQVKNQGVKLESIVRTCSDRLYWRPSGYTKVGDGVVISQ
jgi:hypothetical protein